MYSACRSGNPLHWSIKTQLFYFQMSFYGSENVGTRRALRRPDAKQPSASALNDAPCKQEQRYRKQKSCSSLPPGNFVAIDISESNFKRTHQNRYVKEGYGTLELIATCKCFEIFLMNWLRSTWLCQPVFWYYKFANFSFSYSICTLMALTLIIIV